MAVADAVQDPTPPPVQSPASTTGRVAATITVLEGTVQVGGVDVELIALDGNVAHREDDH